MKTFQAIVTKFTGPRDVKGSRYKATADAGTITIDADHALNSQANHEAAAEALARKLGWLKDGRTFEQEYVGGGLPNSSSYVWLSK